MGMDVIAFVRQHGVVLESAKGPVPNLADAVAGTPIRGNWWNHPVGKQIFRATRVVRDSEQILVCRLQNYLCVPANVAGSCSVSWAIRQESTGCHSRRAFRLGRASSCTYL
jgi:hypothetical protein